MYGWRGRIGHVYPAVVAETYFGSSTIRMEVSKSMAPTTAVT